MWDWQFPRSHLPCLFLQQSVSPLFRGCILFLSRAWQRRLRARCLVFPVWSVWPFPVRGGVAFLCARSGRLSLGPPPPLSPPLVGGASVMAESRPQPTVLPERAVGSHTHTPLAVRPHPLAFAHLGQSQKPLLLPTSYATFITSLVYIHIEPLSRLRVN